MENKQTKLLCCALTDNIPLKTTLRDSFFYLELSPKKEFPRIPCFAALFSLSVSSQSAELLLLLILIFTNPADTLRNIVSINIQVWESGDGGALSLSLHCSFTINTSPVMQEKLSVFQMLVCLSSLGLLMEQL